MLSPNDRTPPNKMVRMLTNSKTPQQIEAARKALQAVVVKLADSQFLIDLTAIFKIPDLALDSKMIIAFDTDTSFDATNEQEKSFIYAKTPFKESFDHYQQPLTHGHWDQKSMTELTAFCGLLLSCIDYIRENLVGLLRSKLNGQGGSQVGEIANSKGELAELLDRYFAETPSDPVALVERQLNEISQHLPLL